MKALLWITLIAFSVGIVLLILMQQKKLGVKPPTIGVPEQSQELIQLFNKNADSVQEISIATAGLGQNNSYQISQLYSEMGELKNKIQTLESGAFA